MDSDLILDGLGLLLALLLVILNGFFVAAEFALVSVRKTRIEQLAHEGHRAAKGVQKALANLDTYIAATQLGITMASLALGFVGESTIARLLEPTFKKFLPPKDALVTAHGLAITIAFALVTSLHIVFGELAPKSVALQAPDRTALLVTAPLNLFLTLFRPFIVALNAVGNAVVRLMGFQPAGGHAAVHSVEELELLVHSSTEAGLLEEQQEQMVAGVFDFKETVVRKMMTPRLDMTAIEADASLKDLVRVVTESGHSRLPVYEETLDNIVGVLHVKDVLEDMLDGDDKVAIRARMRSPYFVPESKRGDFLLAEMRRDKIQMAVVRDEYGTVVGVVTIEDLLEEIVGDIQDEYDVEEPEVEVLDATTSLLDARMSVNDVNERFGLELPEDEVDTIGGFVFGLLGHQAEVGEKISWENVTFAVETTDGKRITKVRLCQQLLPPSDDSLASLPPSSDQLPARTLASTP